MPLIDLHIPSGVLDQGHQDELAQGLLQSLMLCEHAIDKPRAQSINWIYIHEHAPEKVYVAGQKKTNPITESR